MDTNAHCCHLVDRITDILLSLQQLEEIYEYIYKHPEKFNGILQELASEEYQKNISESISRIAFNSVELLEDIPNPCNKCGEEIETLKTSFLELGFKVYAFYNHENAV